MCAKHYAIDKNVKRYTVYFDNTKTVTLNFDVAFPQPPIVQVTSDDSGNFPIYKQKVTTTSCKLKFKTKWTGTVEVLVMER